MAACLAVDTAVVSAGRKKPCGRVGPHDRRNPTDGGGSGANVWHTGSHRRAVPDDGRAFNAEVTRSGPLVGPICGARVEDVALQDVRLEAGLPAVAEVDEVRKPGRARTRGEMQVDLVAVVVVQAVVPCSKELD